MPSAPILRTARLALQPLSGVDLPAVHAIWTDAQVRRYLWDDTVIPVERAADAILASDGHFRSHGYGLWGVYEPPGGALIGFCGCRPWETGEPELLFALRPAWWGRGLATEAARAVLDHVCGTLGCAEVVAAADVPNVASVRVLERLGMAFERRGELHGLDTVFYRLTADPRQGLAAAGPGTGGTRGTILRPATLADEPYLAGAMQSLADFPLPAWRSAGEIARADLAVLRQRLHEPGPDSLILVAEQPAGTAAGFVFATTETDYFTHATHPHVETLAVDPAARGQGVARTLMAAVETWARERGASHITLTVFEANRRARAAYHRLGYAPETVTYRKPLDRGLPASPVPQASPVDLTVRRATRADDDALWPILHHVIAAGDTYAYPPDMPRHDALAAWHPPGGHTFVGECDGRIVGTYLLKANQPGLGSHVANCGYMVAADARGRGIGEALCRHSLETARALGFRAMQFNAVVSTNQAAIALWQRCGFAIVGTVPLAFRHATAGLVDIHVMHRAL